MIPIRVVLYLGHRVSYHLFFRQVGNGDQQVGIVFHGLFGTKNSTFITGPTSAGNPIVNIPEKHGSQTNF